MDGFARTSAGALRDVTAGVRAMRAPLLIALFAFFVLSGPAQILELYLILARGGRELWLQISLAMATLALLCFFITYSGRSLARAAEDVRLVEGERSTQNRVFRVLPIVLGLLPLAGAALGLWRALRSTMTEATLGALNTIAALRSRELVDAALQKLSAAGGAAAINPTDLDFEKIQKRVGLVMPHTLFSSAEAAGQLAMSIYFGIAFCVCCALALALIYGRTPRSDIFEPTNRAYHPAITALVGIVFVVLTTLFTCQYFNAGQAARFDFTQIPRALGALAILNISLISLTYVASLATRWSDRHGIPVLAPLVVIALLISTQNCNDNHAVRLLSSTATERAASGVGDGSRTPVLSDAFDAWLKARPEAYRKKFEGRPYPVYVVAAQGGGTYAANLVGLTLARLYDYCPAIRHHVFAVSAVSGGSIGAGYFSALVNDEATAPTIDTCTFEPPQGGVGPLESSMEALLQADLLAPVMAGMLFPDMIQRFVPYPVVYFDRARAFEASAEEAWTAVAGKGRNPLREPYWRHWRADGASPMLLLNATIAENGQQVVVAPVSIRQEKSYNVIDLKSLRESTDLPVDQDVPLSTAMSLSARFPVVMPAGLVSTPTKQVRLVDGAYFDNSGIETAELLIAQLQNGASDGVAFRTLVLTDFDSLREAYKIGEDPRSSGEGLNEVLSPLRAMMNARLTRGELAVGRLKAWEPDASPPEGATPAVMIMLNHRLYGLPLGWQLSKPVQALIAAQIGDPNLCVSKKTGDFKTTLDQIAALEQGLELVAAEKEGRAPKPANPVFVSPFIEMLTKLQNNNCGVISALAADGIAPPRP